MKKVKDIYDVWFAAARSGSREDIIRMIDEGIDIHRRDAFGVTAWDYALLHPEIRKILDFTHKIRHCVWRELEGRYGDGMSVRRDDPAWKQWDVEYPE